MTRHWIAPSLAIVLSACSGTTLHSAPRMPEFAKVCSGDPSAASCLADLQRASERGDRGKTGQLLLLAARSAPTADRRDLARAALWLAPDAWVPDDLRGLLTDDDLDVIATSSGAKSRVAAGSVLRLRGSVAPPSSLAATEVDLAIPSGKGPLTGDSLAGLLASAAGADAASYAAGGAPHLAVAAPLLSRVLGTGVGVAPEAWASARLASQADRSLREGRQAQAWLTLKEAIDALPATSGPCTVRGELDYLRATVARVAFEGNDTDTLADLRKVCTGAVVPEDERQTQRYLTELLGLQTNLSTAAGELPAPWSSAPEREAWSRGIDELARTLGDRRSDILRALRDDLLARASLPTGRCDDGWSARVVAERAAAKKAIRAAGREDLALPMVDTRSEGVRVEVVDVDTVLTWTQQPENKWLRVPTLAGILSDPALMLASEVYRPQVEKVCSTAFDELFQEIKSDRLEGYDGRNVSRWFSASRGIALCRRLDSIASLSDELLRGALQGKGGKSGALKVLMLTGFQALEALLNGRAHEGMLAIKVMKDGLERLSGHLGAGDEDRVLDAVIGVVGAAVDRVMSQSGDLAVALERAAAALEPIARKPVDPQAPELVRAAPGIHLAAIALLAAVDAVDQDTRGRDAALARLQASVDRDVQALLGAFGVPEYGPAILRVVKAATEVAKAADGNGAVDVDALIRSVDEASKPGEKEDRWWGVGLNLSRLVLWDLSAVAIVKSAAAAPSGAAAADPMSDPRMTKVLDRADQTLVRLTDGIVRDWGETGRTWEFMYVTPALHRGIVAMILAPEGAPDMGERTAKAMQGGLDAGLSRMSQQVKDARPEEVGFLAVLIDALELAQTEGGMPALVEQAEARVRWARRLREQTAAYPPEYRVVINAATAAAEFEADRVKARALLQDAAQEAAHSQFGDVAWLPRLVEAALLYRDGDFQGALQAVDQIMVAGKESASCNKPHEVLGLLPFRAFALERLGRHADADATLRQYLESAKQFGGDGTVQCRLVSYRNAFTFTADVKQRLGSVFFRTSSEGTFQVGAGYGDSRNYDRLTCISSPMMMPRLDLVMTAQLMRAAYALRAGDDAEASDALLGALGAGRSLVNGDVSSLGLTDGAAVEEARKHAYLPLMAYVAVAARGRGHLAAADQLEKTASDIASARIDNLAASLNNYPGIPPQLEKLGFDALEPVVTTAWEEPSGKDDKKPAPATAAAGPSVIPAWGMPVVESYALLRRSRMKEAAAAAQKARPPAGDPIARIAVERAKARVAGAKAATPSAAVVTAQVETLARAGMFTEVQGVVADRVARLVEGKKDVEAMDFAMRALALIPANKAPLARADLLVDLGSRVTAVMSRRDWLTAITEVEPALQGRVPLQLEVAVLQRILASLANAGAPARILPHVQRMRGVIERALGTDHPEALKLGVVELLLRSLDSPPPQKDVDELLASIHKAGASADRLLTVMDAWSATRERPADRRTVVLRFVEQVFTQ